MKLRMNAEQSSTEEFIDRVISRYHFQEKDRQGLKLVRKELLKSISPYAVYKIPQWITGVKKIDENQAALVAITLGEAPDSLQEHFTEEGELQEAYMVECISNEMLLDLYGEFNKSYADIHRRYVSGYYFIGDDVELDNMGQLLEKLKENQSEEFDINVNEFGVLIPSKSVMFYVTLSDNPKQACEGICYNCKNSHCENRMSINESERDVSYTLNYGFQRIFSNEENIASP